jgi:branched-chain amino acid transport system permease protein
MRSRSWATHAIAVCALVALPSLVGSFTAYILDLALVYVILSLGLSMALGYAGQVNLAQAACFGMGSYTLAVLTIKAGLGYWGAFAPAVAGGALLGLVVSLPSLRVQSHYLGIVTLGLGVAFTAVLTNWSLAGAAVGLPGVPGPTVPGVDLADPRHLYYLLLVIAVVLFALALLMMGSGLGRRFKALRDDHVAAAHSGVEVRLHRIVAFTIAGAYAGVAGALYAGMAHYVSPDTYSLNIMFLLLAMVIIGGRDNLYGAALGAVALILVRQEFVSLQQYEQVAYGALIVLAVLFAPSGLAGLVTTASRRLAAVARTRHGSTAVAPAAGMRPSAPAAGDGSLSLARRPSPPGDTILAIAGVGKRFRGVTAVDGLTLEIRSGTIHGVVGPNGSGKTTLFDLITGVHAPSAGRITLSGARVSGRRPERTARRGVRRTFQTVRLFSSLSVRENVMVALDADRAWRLPRYVLAPWRVVTRERELRRLADRHLAGYGLAAVADLRATDLPYGRQRLVEIARAMAGAPSILLLDEPAAGLNPREMRELAELIREIRRSGTTVLLIEHNMSLVMSLCDRVTVLVGGGLLADGPPSAVARDPDVVAAYLGDGAALALALEGSLA